MFFVYQRAGLVYMGAQNFTQSSLQQMAGGVVAGDGGTALGINGSLDLLVGLDVAFQNNTLVGKVALGGFSVHFCSPQQYVQVSCCDLYHH